MREETRRDCVDANAVARPLGGHLLRHRRLRGFSRGGVGVARKSGPDVLRGVVDDRSAPAPPDHAASEFARAQECAVDRDPRYRVPGVGRDVLGQRLEVRPGVVGEQRNRAERGFDRIECRGNLFGDANVAAQRVDLAPQSRHFRRARLGLFQTAAHDRNLCATLREGHRRRQPHSRSAAADEHSATGKDIRRIGRLGERRRGRYNVMGWH